MQVIEKSALCFEDMYGIFPGVQSHLYQMYSFQTTTEWNKCFSTKYTHLMLSLHSILCKNQLICSSITLHRLCSGHIKHLSSQIIELASGASTLGSLPCAAISIIAFLAEIFSSTSFQTSMHTFYML